MELADYKIGACCNVFIGYARIYTLSDINDNVFYVGCTTQDLQKRLACHLAEAKANTPKSNSLKNLFIMALDFRVTIRIVEEKFVTGFKAYSAVTKAKDLELKWVRKFISRGATLCNNREIKDLKKMTKLNRSKRYKENKQKLELQVKSANK